MSKIKCPLCRNSEIPATLTVEEFRHQCAQAAEYAAGRVALGGASDDGLTFELRCPVLGHLGAGGFYC